MTVSLEDLEIRYKNIREQNPKVKKCSVKGCNNPRDSTPLLGGDTCCAYHRLLFDFWFCDVRVRNYKNREAQGKAFENWLKRIGKKTQNELALKMAQEPINWKC